jgi:hypothetical protein
MKILLTLLLLFSVLLADEKPDTSKILWLSGAGIIGQNMEIKYELGRLVCPYCNSHLIITSSGTWYPESKGYIGYNSGKLDSLITPAFFIHDFFIVKCLNCGGIETTEGKDSVSVIKQYKKRYNDIIRKH